MFVNNCLYILFIVVYFVGSTTSLVDTLPSNNTTDVCSPEYTPPYQCLHISTDWSELHVTDAVLICTGINSTYIEQNHLFKLQTEFTDECNWPPYCQIIYNDGADKLCPLENVKGVIFIDERIVIKVQYEHREDLVNVSRFLEWSKCHDNLQFRQSFLPNGALNEMQVRECHDGNNQSITNSRSLWYNTAGCRNDRACIVVNYLDPKDPNLQTLQSVHLMCTGNHSTISDYTLYLQKFYPDKEMCRAKPHCEIVFDNMLSKLCQSQHRQGFTFLKKSLKFTVVYKTCEGLLSWSSWTSCENNLHFRYQRCPHGPLKKFQIQLCTTDVSPSSTILQYSPSTYIKSTHIMTSLTSLTSTAVISIMETPTLSSSINIPKNVTTGIISPTTSYLLVASTSRQPIIDYCSSEIIGDISYKGEYHFPTTKVYDVYSISCYYGNRVGYTGNITRRCIFDGKAKWQMFDLSMCLAKSVFSNTLLDMLDQNVTQENVYNLTTSLETTLVDTTTLTSREDVNNIVTLIDNCVGKALGDVKTSHKLFGSIGAMMNFDRNTLQSGKRVGNLLQHLNTLANALDGSNSSIAYSSKYLAFSKKEITQNTDLKITTSSQNMKLQIEFQKVDSNNSSTSILIPHQVFKDLSYNKTIQSFCFENDKLFTSQSVKQHNFKISSKVLSASIEGVKIENLKTNIHMKFTVARSETTPNCSFWDDTNASLNQHRWSSKGCKRVSIVYTENQSTVNCECDHLTNFAILLSPISTTYNPKELQVISFIGCIVSIATLFATIFIYLFFRELHRSIPQKILINFCISLLCLLTVFIFGVEVEDVSVCHQISALLHYFTLSTFLWMGVECVSLYKSVVTVRRKTVGKRFLWCCAVVCWGIPAFVAGITSYFSKEQFYNPSFCILKGHLYLMTTVIPVSVILIINFILFIPIMRQIQNHLSTKEKYQDKKDYTRRIRVSFSCAVLLGLTWIFGIFAIGEFKVIFQWIFAILNSFQGLLIFLFHVLLKYEARQAFRRLCGFKYRKHRFSLSNSSRSTRTVKLSML